MNEPSIKKPNTLSRAGTGPASAPPRSGGPATDLNRRLAMVGLTWAFVGAAAGCGSETEATAPAPTGSSPPAPPPLPPTAPSPPSSSAPAPTAPAPAPSASYRNGQAYLFTSIQGLQEPARIAGGQPYSFVGVGSGSNLITVGPTRNEVDMRSGWNWDSPGGDWIDSALTRMGNSPWASIATPNGTNDVTYSVSVTAALQRVFSAGRWNAWVARKLATGGGAPRQVYGRFAANSAFHPRLDVTYSDGTAATLACRTCGSCDQGSSLPDQSSWIYTIYDGPAGGWLLEFERPTKAVQSATLFFTVSNHWGGAATLEFNLADPPVNTDGVGSGLAAAYPLDAGISAHGSVIFSHRYQDGAIRRDFILQSQDNPIGSIDYGARAPFDPALWGGTSNTSRLPHVGLGKWIGGSNRSAWNGTPVDGDPNFGIVPSNYSGEGFVPLAPGLGALRVHMPAGKDSNGNPIVDGSTTSGSSPTIDARMYMPMAKLGLLGEAWLRYYVFIDATYAPTLADKKQVYEGGNAVWIDMGGKWLIGFSHWSSYGGNNNYGGGGQGWSLRPEFSDNMTDMDPKSPQYRSYGMGLSWVDYTNNGWNASTNPYGQPVTHSNYPGLPRSRQEPGQRGGLMSRLYPGRWYCIEEHIKLNAANAPSGAGDGRNWAADGEVEWYLDGRLAFRETGRVFRSLPANPGNGTRREPFREIGIADIWMNFYHGGVTQNSYARTFFVAGLVVAEQRVGPMKI